MTGTLKVTPDRLISASADFKRHDSRVVALTQQMMNIVNSLNGCWEGQAQMTYCNKFKSLQDDMSRMHSKISEHATDLEEMARHYIQSESKNIQSFGGLNSHFIG